jgi:Lrp/AsnC family transcriptional regulator
MDQGGTSRPEQAEREAEGKDHVFEVALPHLGGMFAKQALQHHYLLGSALQPKNVMDFRRFAPNLHRLYRDEVENIPIIVEETDMDERDRAIMREIQRDASLSLENLAERVHLSRNACWRRVKQLEEQGFIRARVALLDAAKLNLGLTAFIAIRTAHHDPEWLERFAVAVRGIPEIIGVYRTSGEIDYLLHVVVPDIAGYDALYKRLIARIPLTDVSSSFVMEKVKETTILPLDYI